MTGRNFEKSPGQKPPAERQVFSADENLNESLYGLAGKIDILLESTEEIPVYRLSNASDPDIDCIGRLAAPDGTEISIGRSKKPDQTVVYYVDQQLQDADGNRTRHMFEWGFGAYPKAATFRSHFSQIHLTLAHQDGKIEVLDFDQERLDQVSEVIDQYERLGNE